MLKQRRRTDSVPKKPPRGLADFEVYDFAEMAVTSGGLSGLTITDSDKARIQALTQIVAHAVSTGRLASPGERAQDYYLIEYFQAEVERFSSICWAFIEFFITGESINADRLAADAAENLRRFLERMDDHDRKKTIAGLMAYIGELQTAGVLEATPSDRLARVAKLIGEAAEIVSANPSKFVPLFGDRLIDPSTGKKPTALEWFDQVWKPRVDAGEVLGADLKRADPAFYSTLSSTLSRKNQKLTDLLPPSPTGRPRNPGPTDARLEHARELNRKRVARWRAGKSAPK
ncbi:MAG: hypothetical protein R3C52_04270 [Hyphomonadaceae bacterium]